MIDNNINKLQKKSDSSGVYIAKVTLSKNFYIENYDEGTFKLLGQQYTYVAFTELIHPDDVEAFLAAVDDVEKEPQYVIFRLKGYEEIYRSVCGIISKNERISAQEGFVPIDVEFYELMTIADRYKYYVTLVEKYREFMSMSTEAFMEYDCFTDEFMIYIYNNRNSSKTVSIPLTELKEKVKNSETLSEKQKAEFEILCLTIEKGQNHARIEIDAECLEDDADKVRYEIRTGLVYSEGEIAKVVGLVKTISRTERRKSYYLSENAYDPGTGLFNKRAINEYAMEKIQAKTPDVCIAIVDLDDFKNINDTYGHMYGDEVLSTVAKIMQNVVKNKGAVGRFGGDEFMLVLEKVKDADSVRQILSTIGQNVRFQFNKPDGPKVTLSIGSARYPFDGDTYEEVFRKADKCVYIAKMKGKNRYVMYIEEKHGAVVVEDGRQTNIGLRSGYSDSKKHDAVSNFIMQLHTGGMASVKNVMKEMQIYFDIDGITIYGGADFGIIDTVGKYINQIENMDFAFDEEYLSHYDEQSFYDENHIERLENSVPAAFEKYTKQENGKFMQCMVTRNKKPVVVLSYDFFNRRVKHGVTDIGLMKLVGRLMAEVVAESFEQAN